MVAAKGERRREDRIPVATAEKLASERVSDPRGVGELARILSKRITGPIKRSVSRRNGAPSGSTANDDDDNIIVMTREQKEKRKKPETKKRRRWAVYTRVPTYRYVIMCTAQRRRHYKKIGVTRWEAGAAAARMIRVENGAKLFTGDGDTAAAATRNERREEGIGRNVPDLRATVSERRKNAIQGRMEKKTKVK